MQISIAHCSHVNDTKEAQLYLGALYHATRFVLSTNNDKFALCRNNVAKESFTYNICHNS
jgi:hypothetical protein